MYQKLDFMCNKNKLMWLIFGIIVLSQVSCRELVQDEFPEMTPVPTVNSFLVADSTIKVYVSLAAKLDTFQLDVVDEAEVQLYVDGIFEENLSLQGNGMYESECLVEAGSVYLCKVDIDDFDPVSCTDSIPIPSSILGVEHIDIAGIDEEGYTYAAFKLTFSNLPEEQRYYEVIIRLKYRDYWREGYLQNIVDPVLLSEGLPMSVFSNDLMDDETYTLLINYATGSVSTRSGVLRTDLFPFILELRSISYNYYQYLRQLYLYNLGRFPEFAGGSMGTFPLHSNVENGYGIFAGYSSTFSELINPDSTRCESK